MSSLYCVAFRPHFVILSAATNYLFDTLPLDFWSRILHVASALDKEKQVLYPSSHGVATYAFVYKRPNG